MFDKIASRTTFQASSLRAFSFTRRCDNNVTWLSLKRDGVKQYIWNSTERAVPVNIFGEVEFFNFTRGRKHQSPAHEASLNQQICALMGGLSINLHVRSSSGRKLGVDLFVPNNRGDESEW